MSDGDNTYGGRYVVNPSGGLLSKGQPARLSVVRRSENLEIEVVPREKGKVEGEQLDCPRWDFTVKAINQFDNPDLYFQRKEGVFIYGIKVPGNAAGAGLSQQDIVLKIDGKEVRTLDEVREVQAG